MILATSSITALSREREHVSQSQLFFPSCLSSQTATSQSKQLPKNNKGWDMCSLSLGSAVMLDVIFMRLGPTLRKKTTTVSFLSSFDTNRKVLLESHIWQWKWEDRTAAKIPPFSDGLDKFESSFVLDWQVEMRRKGDGKAGTGRGRLKSSINKAH